MKSKEMINIQYYIEQSELETIELGIWDFFFFLSFFFLSFFSQIINNVCNDTMVIIHRR